MVEGGRVLPALPEGDRQVADGRAADLQLHVVPGRVRAVALVHRHRLGVAQVALVVAAPVAQVDAAHEGDVVLGPGASEQHQLLVVAPAAPDALVEHELAETDGPLARAVAAIELQLTAEVNPFIDAAIERFEKLWRSRRE